MVKKAYFKISAVCIALSTLWPNGIVANTKSLGPFKPSQAQVAKALLWQPYTDRSTHLCSGYYTFDPTLSGVGVDPFKIGHGATTVSSKGSSLLLANGKSVLRDQVVFRQKGRKITAQKAEVYRDNHSSNITHVKLYGHVKDATADTLIACPYANVDLKNHDGYFLNAMMRHHYISDKDGPVTSWGTATIIRRQKDGNANFENHLQFSLCSPVKPSWLIHARKGFYNKTTGELQIYHGYITFHHVPIFFSPYFSIATANKRKSGLLVPKFGYSSTDGFHVGMRYYFNLAPNYDDLLTNGWYTKRGYYLKNKFRWITQNSSGNINFYGLPSDQAFGRFRNQSLQKWQTTDPTDSMYPYYEALKNDSLTRYSIDAKGQVSFAGHWSAAAELHHVSDDYFLQDFSNIITDGLIEPNQLYSYANLNYNNTYHQFSLAASGYQTLHPYGLGADNQYSELGVQDNWVFPAKRLNVSLQSDITSFLMPNDFFTSPKQIINKIVDGTRFHARANMLLPWIFSAGYIKAGLGYDMLADELSYVTPKTQTAGLNTGVMPDEVTRTLPIVNVDSGIYFVNQHLLNNKELSSTIEPEVSYLYVPYQNQQTLPIFDTTPLPLTYDTLYSTNQFLGVDRLQNANQFNLGIKTTMTNSHTGLQWLTIGTGTQYYMTPQKVQLTYQGYKMQPLNKHRFSPWVNEMTLTPVSGLSTTLDWNWDWYQHQTSSLTATIDYSYGDTLRLMTSYEHLAPQTQDSSPVNLYTFGLATPIGSHLEAFTYQYFDGQADRMLASLQGFQYDSCCWALRAAYSHQWEHTDTSQNPALQVYNNAVYVEFILKGLGDFGADLKTLLNSDFNGYNYR